MGRPTIREASSSQWRAARLLARRLRPQPRALPDVLILGAQRAGTTSLFHWLTAHPQVHQPIDKEPQFFSLEWSRGSDWYRQHFGPDGDGHANVEASPYYLYHPLAPARVGATVPRARCIALLRDPVARAISHHRHNLRLGLETQCFATAVALEEERLAGEAERICADPTYASAAHRQFSYVDRGRYDRQLDRWRQVPNPLLVLDSDDLFLDPHGTFQRVLAFLELDPWRPTTYANWSRDPAGNSPPIDRQVRASVVASLEASVTRLAQQVDWDPGRWLAA